MAEYARANTPRPDADQRAAPLVEALERYAMRNTATFHTPGHRQGFGAPDDLIELVGSQAFATDLTTLPETDCLSAPHGVIADAERLAAAAWGADRTFFLANGSTVGNQAAVIAACGPGDRIVVPRSIHRSTLSGIILAGADPVFVTPPWDPQLGIAHPLTTASAAEALVRHADARAVMVVSPTYHGVSADTAAIADICARRDVTLIVDEAWGAHLHFHPELPQSALDAGADMVVQSTHKTLAAMTQASLLHVRGRCRGFRRDILGLLQSTSPSYLLLASLDASRRQMVLHGKDLMERALTLARELRTGLAAIDGVRVMSMDDVAPFGPFGLDETRVIIDVSNLGVTGHQMRDLMNRRYDVQPEMAGLREVVLLVTIGTAATDVERAIEAVAAIAATHPGGGDLPRSLENPLSVLPCEAMTPREAFFAAATTVRFDDAVGRISSEIVAPYPPGIPLLVPGERITVDVHDLLRIHREHGSVFNGPDDATLATMRVVAKRTVAPRA